MAVHQAARIAAAACPGEVLVSSTTYQLAAGIELALEEHGERHLKGLSGPRTLYGVPE